LFGNIILASLDKPEHEELARKLCAKLLDAVINYRVNSWDVGHVVEALMKISPVAVLDILVEQNETNVQINARSVFEYWGKNMACPFQALPEHVWREWAEAKPKTRYVQLAKVVKFSTLDHNEKSSAWSPIAEKIFDTAPDPVKVLDEFFYRFQPTMGWSGPLADILDSRMILIDILKGHPKPEIVKWAETRSLELEVWIKREREEASQWNKVQDEGFE
jgi:hypothetical protein